MELESSYNLLGVLRDDGIRTYRAVEIASGQELQVHLFAKSDSEPDRALFKALRALPVSKRRELLEMGMEGDHPYIVTEALPDGSTAREWLTKLAGVPAKPSGQVFLSGSWKTGTPIPDELLKASHPSAPPVLPTPKQPAELSADYTRVMRVPLGLGKMQPPPETPPEAPVSQPSEVSQKPETILPPEPPVIAAPTPAEELDEFARMFGDPAPPAVGLAVAPVAPQHKPGEFTQMFGDPAPPAVGPAIAPVAPQHDQAEFARMFGDPAPPVVGPAIAPVAPQHEPGEFTQMFLATQAPSVPDPPKQQPAIPATPVNQPGEFTSQFLALKQPPPDIPPAPAIGVASKQPGEFTSMFLATQPAPVTPPVGPPPVQATTPPPHLQADTPPAVQPPQVQPPSEESTRLFQAVTPSAPPSGLTSSPSGLTSPPKGGKNPGEFTRMFPSVEQKDSPLGTGPGPGIFPEPPAKEGPSEFTRFFQSPMYPTPAGNQAPAGNQRMTPSTPAPQPIARPSAQPSEFTQMFGSPGKSAGMPPPPPLASGTPSSATGVFSIPKSTTPRAPVRTGGAPAGPGEFTRMMSASAPATFGQQVAKTEEPEAKTKSNVLLYVAGGAVVLAIVLIIVFLVMKH